MGSYRGAVSHYRTVSVDTAASTPGDVGLVTHLDCSGLEYFDGVACQMLRWCAVATQFELRPPSATADRSCHDLTVCTAEQYEGSPPTAATDRACRRTSDCHADQYELTAPSPTTDRVCTAVQPCTEEQFEVAPATRSADKIC